MLAHPLVVMSCERVTWKRPDVEGEIGMFSSETAGAVSVAEVSKARAYEQ